MSFMSNFARPSRVQREEPLGAGNTPAHAARTDENEASSTISPRVREARRDLLDGVADFTMKHDLDVTGANLAAICNGLSGANTQLAEAFVAREISGEPIDQRWLDSVVRLDPDTKDRLAELDQLMDELEYSLIRFGQTAKSAADETSDQRGVIDAQINEMGTAASSGNDVARVIDLSRSMLENIERVEFAMVNSQEESAVLRENLARARMEADVDHLTRLPNRRAFERRLANEAQRAASTGSPLCVAFCDVDHFKAVNDTHGHEAGDRILCAVATMLNSVASENCFVARHGGEEFVLLFYGLEKDAAFEKFDGVRRAMARKQLMNRDTGKPFGKVTFSGGLAQVTDHADPRTALAEADAALYEAKQSGRNKIVAAN